MLQALRREPLDLQEICKISQSSHDSRVERLRKMQPLGLSYLGLLSDIQIATPATRTARAVSSTSKAKKILENCLELAKLALNRK